MGVGVSGRVNECVCVSFKTANEKKIHCLKPLTYTQVAFTYREGIKVCE